jgi:ornithine cyclodeaminase
MARHAGRYVELVAMAPDPRDLYGWMMAGDVSADTRVRPAQIGDAASFVMA